MIKKRVRWLDFARGLTIFFVVCGHSLSSIYATKNIDTDYFKGLMSLLFTFMMPCFFAISGYLYKPIYNLHAFCVLFYKKSISLGLPYILFSVIYVFMQRIGGRAVNHAHSFSSLLTIYSNPISYLWFLYALFIIFMIIGIFDLLNINHFIQFVLCFILMSIGIIFPNATCPGIDAGLTNIIYFYIGYLIANIPYKWISIIHLKAHKITLLLSILFIVLFIIQSFFVTGDYVNNTTFSDFITKLVSVLLLIQISSSFSHNKIFRYFDKYGQITLIIYLIHGPTMSVMRALSFKLIRINYINVIPLSLILIIIVWYISILACYLVNRFTILNFIFYPRKNYISKLIVKTKWGRKFLNI